MDPARPDGALPLAGGWAWWALAEELTRDGAARLIPAADVPWPVRRRLSAPRPAIAGLGFDRPRLMGILNTTPDSFSDGGQYDSPESAIRHGRALAGAGADIIDIGGESTRPGAETVPPGQETDRTAPVIKKLREAGLTIPVSIDTRKAPVAQAALAAGADIINDVSGLTHDPAMARVASDTGAGLCIMHARGAPKTMQDNPYYNNVLLDIYDHLERQVAAAAAAGIRRDRIIVDPGIGFGKTIGHNVALVRNISLFHGLGCPVLLGVSRKGFIGVIGHARTVAARGPGSVALGLAGLGQGVQILRVHDVADTRQAVALWQAANGVKGGGDDY
ncbi:MAG: dihydropteroate synthase [Rhodobacteraceae bacterium]|nr:dihydropteroate synthase [Paracoccaceae bacterium]